MTGILLFTAGRKDAYEDYKEAVLEGYPIEEIQPHLTNEELEEIAELYNEERVRLWGTTVDSNWQKVDSGDIALVYRRGSFIARAQVVTIIEKLELARGLWSDGKNWDEENPWRYLVFLTDVEEIDVGIEEFNDLFEYDSSYYPQGFIRVADKRVATVEEEYESIETAIAELTGTGERVHKIDDEDEEETQESIEEFIDKLIRASEDGDRDKEFERLVAEAFSRLGFEARWIEGGGDTDVEITAPVRAIVEAKARGRTSGVVNMNASRIATHRDQHNADYGFVVGRHFPPGSNEDAERNDLTTLSADILGKLLRKRERYGIPPEVLLETIQRPGGVTDDRIDELDEYIQERLDSAEVILRVLEALARRREVGKDAAALQNIILGMETETEELPTVGEIQQAIDFLSHPGFGILEEDDNGHRLKTSYQNSLRALESFGAVLDDVIG